MYTQLTWTAERLDGGVGTRQLITVYVYTAQLDGEVGTRQLITVYVYTAQLKDWMVK